MGHSAISPTIGDQFPEVGLLLRVEGRADIDVVVDPDVRVMKERVVVEVDVPRRDVPIERPRPPAEQARLRLQVVGSVRVHVLDRSRVDTPVRLCVSLCRGSVY